MSGAFDVLRQVVGPEHVFTDERAVREAAANTYALERRPAAIVRPGSTKEVAEVVRCARAHGVAIQPLSRGKNWGYGSRLAPVDGAWIVDLSRMDKILEFNEELAYVRVQAGVAFGTLSAFLNAQGARAMQSAIGGPPTSSVVGNIVERGLGKGTYGDRFLNSCDLEVVLADGEVVRTGFGAFPNARAAPVHRWGVGPNLDGLFSQSNLGIVTEATLWLQRKTDGHLTCLFWINDDAVGRLVDAVRELKLEGTVTSTSLIANEVRRMAFMRQYPWELTNGQTPLPAEVRKRLRVVGAWSGDLTLYGATPQIRRALRDRVEQVLRPVTDGLMFSDDPTGDNEIAKRAIVAIDRLGSGQLIETANSPAYWRSKVVPGPTSDPNEDGCGLMWFSPAVPMRGADAEWCMKTAEEELLRFGFDPNLGLNCFSDRALDATTMIVYDRKVEGEDERAAACFTALLETFARRGYFPYRLPVGYGPVLREYRKHGIDERLVQAFDPDGVFARGRYIG